MGENTQPGEVFHGPPRKVVETRNFELALPAHWVRVQRDEAGYLLVTVMDQQGRELMALDTSGGRAKVALLEPTLKKGTSPFNWRWK